MLAILRERASYSAREPIQDPALARCIRVWRYLAGDRAIGVGARGTIPFTALRVWAEHDGLDRESTMILYDAILYADGERMRLAAAKAALENMRGKDRS